MLLSVSLGDMVIQGKVAAEDAIADRATDFGWRSRRALDGHVLRQFDLGSPFAIIFKSV